MVLFDQVQESLLQQLFQILTGKKTLQVCNSDLIFWAHIVLFEMPLQNKDLKGKREFSLKVYFWTYDMYTKHMHLCERPSLGNKPFFPFVFSGQSVWNCNWRQHRVCCEAGGNQLHPLPCQQQRPAAYLGENTAKIHMGARAWWFGGILLYFKSLLKAKHPCCTRCICSLVLF